MIFINGAVFILLFYGLCALGLLSVAGTSVFSKLRRSFSAFFCIALLIVLIVPTLLMIYWSSKDNCIYYWDFAGYWSSTINQMNYMRVHSLTECIENVFRSINSVSYNNFLSSVAALPVYVLGDSHRKFVLINYLLFYLPTVLVVGLISAELSDSDSSGPNAYARGFVFGCAAAVLIPACYYPLLRGYIDAAFLLPSAIVLYHLIRCDFSNGTLAEDLSIAALLVLTWISRRYAVYLIIGYVTALMIKAIVYVRRDSSHAVKRMVSVLYHVLSLGGASAAILIIFFRPFLISALTNNYMDSYSAYDSSLLTKIKSVASSYGLTTLIFILIISVSCVLLRYQTVNLLLLFCVGLISTALFWRTQDMDIHHRMLLYLPAVLILCIGSGLLFERMETESHNKNKYRAAFIFFLIILSVNLCNAFSGVRSFGITDSLFAMNYQPIIRNDLNELKELTAELQTLEDAEEQGIYVAAAADILNVDIIRKFRMPDSDVAVEYLLGTSDVDLRDGFPADFLSARYVVCTDPVQTHLPYGQEVVRYINDSVQDTQSCIGRHYKKIFETKLDRDTSAYIYRRESDFTDEDLSEISSHFESMYPGREALFSNRILSESD